MKRNLTHNAAAINERPDLYLIIILGQPMSLKSTLANDLAAYLQCGLVSTAFFGEAVFLGNHDEFQQIRDMRYAACANIARCYLSEGWPLIVDGNFEERRWRQLIWDLVKEKSIPFGIVQCVCRDIDELQRRQELRMRMPFAPDRHSLPYASNAAPVKSFVLDEEEFPGQTDSGFFQVDTGAWKIYQSSRTNSTMKWLERGLSEWLLTARDESDST